MAQIIISIYIYIYHIILMSDIGILKIITKIMIAACK